MSTAAEYLEDAAVAARTAGRCVILAAGHERNTQVADRMIATGRDLIRIAYGLSSLPHLDGAGWPLRDGPVVETLNPDPLVVAWAKAGAEGMDR